MAGVINIIKILNIFLQMVPVQKKKKKKKNNVNNNMFHRVEMKVVQEVNIGQVMVKMIGQWILADH